MIIKAPQRAHIPLYRRSVFLAGSIEMGTAANWQEYVTERLVCNKGADFIFNPRRDDWDSSWEQTIENPQFREQVFWELDHINKADIVFFYFDPNTKSPITLLEIGLTAAAGKDIIVVCPDGFWRKGNIEVLCAYYGVTLYDELECGVDSLIYRFGEK